MQIKIPHFTKLHFVQFGFIGMTGYFLLLGGGKQGRFAEFFF